MAFQKKRISPKTTRKKYTKKTYNSRKKIQKKSWEKKWLLWKMFLYGFLWLFLFGLIWLVILYQKVIVPLPSISELENIDIAEASIIYDRDGNELYKIFEEKRTYRNFGDINENIINALVAWEDQRYWENPGVDFIGLVRAWIYWVIWKNEWFWGTSTLTQQLIRNTIIENRSSNETIFDKLERKIKEIYLAFKLTNGVSKEKIIELYLNKISFWSNAFWIEQASQTFFWKSARDIGILEGSMLASLPKWPSYYSPYSNYDRLVWYPYIYNEKDTESIINVISPSSLEENSAAVESLKSFISWFKVQRYSDSKALICGLDREQLKSNISIDADGCSVIDYSEFLTLLNSIKIRDENWQITEYQIGRKDFILWRMLEDKYISFEEYKEALLESIGFEFEQYSENIKHPHFVFYVREFLEEKYGKEILEKWWLRVYTSLDPDLQKKAEELVEKQAKINTTKFAAENAALISLDNETWEILAMVWWRDYFDEEKKWNVNMVTAALQPGSSFKPFVYALAIDQEIIWSKTPVYDVKTTFPGWYTPKNFDWGFKGKMNISTALNSSRNIPAIKMFYLAWGEEKILEWMEKLWVDSIRKFKEEYSLSSWTTYTYGSSMALWTVMMSPLESAQAYSVFANMWYKKDLVPVIKILDSKWLVIEEFKKQDNQWEQVIDSATAYILNYILSDASTRPSFWNTYLSLNGRKVAAKTGTSTKQSSKGWTVVYPRNLWTVWYTPQVTTVVWAWNNDGSETNLKWNGLEWAWPIWKEFMEYYHSGKWALDWKSPSGVKQVSISDISWKLAPEWFDSSLVTSSFFVNAPREYDASLSGMQVDLLCNGIVDEKTPISAIGTVNFLSLNSLRPNNPAWEWPVQAWVQAWNFDDKIPGWNFITSVNQEACERIGFAGDIEVWASINNGDTFVAWSNYIEVWYKSTSELQQVDVYLDDQKIQQIPVNGGKSWVFVWNLNIPKGALWTKNLTFRAIDKQYYSQWVSYSINVIKKDIIPPEITVLNPIDKSISLYREDFFNLRGNIKDRGAIRSINIYVNDTPVKIGIEWREFSEKILWEWLPLWENIIKIEAVDMEFNIGETQVVLNIIES